MTELLFEKTFSHDSLPELAEEISACINQSDPFVLWLKGDLGLGKTTTTSAIPRHLGVSEETPIVSPTYTLCNEYEGQGQWYAHLDLYRAGADFSLQELGVEDTRTYRGFFVEWPEQPGEEETLPPTHKLTIDFVNETTRTFRLEQIS